MHGSSSVRHKIEKAKGRVKCDAIVFLCGFIIPFILIFIYGSFSTWFWYCIVFFPYAMIGHYGLQSSKRDNVSTLSAYIMMLKVTKIITFIISLICIVGFIISWVYYLNYECDRYNSQDCDDDKRAMLGLMVLSGTIFAPSLATFLVSLFGGRHARKLRKLLEKDAQLTQPLIANQNQYIQPQANYQNQYVPIQPNEYIQYNQGYPVYQQASYPHPSYPPSNQAV